jgi:hypothetical protein
MRLSRATTLLLLCLPLVLPANARATKPAVKQINGRVFGSYLYESIDGAEAVAGTSSVTLPGSNDGVWDLGGVVTAPLFDWLGGRLRLAGGKSSLELQGAPGFAGSTVDSGRIDAGLTIFARDPELGHFDVGYRFGWENPSGSIVDKSIVNGVTLAGGFYIPDQVIGPLDWDAFFSYGRVSQSSSLQTDAIDEYTVGAALGWYIVDSLRLSGGVRWLGTVPQTEGSRGDLRGFGELVWLLPFGERRNVSASLFGSGGSIASSLPAPFSTVRQGVFSVGGRLTFSYPGAASLVELIREYH